MASTCPVGSAAGLACHGLSVAGDAATGKLGSAANQALGAVGGSVLSQVAQSMSSAADGLLKTLTTFWMNVDTPTLDSAGSTVTAIEKQTGWITTCIAVVCILVAAARMAIRRRGQPAQVMLLGLVRLVVVCAVGTFLIQAAGKLGDQFSSDLMSSAHVGTSGWSGLISTTTLSAAFAPGDGMLLIVSLLVIISSLIQLMLMVLRVGLLVILTGTLPLAAAASMSEWGETWWRRHLGWLTAWLLYKPAAAVLYTSAFALTHSSGLVEVMAGFMLLLLSVLALPALLKVIMPMTAQLGAASGGSLTIAVAGALATGAIKVAKMAGTGGAAAGALAGTGDAPSGNALPPGGEPSGNPSGAGPNAPGGSSATGADGTGDPGTPQGGLGTSQGGPAGAAATASQVTGQASRAGETGAGHSASHAPRHQQSNQPSRGAEPANRSASGGQSSSADAGGGSAGSSPSGAGSADSSTASAGLATAGGPGDAPRATAGGASGSIGGDGGGSQPLPAGAAETAPPPPVHDLSGPAPQGAREPAAADGIDRTRGPARPDDTPKTREKEVDDHG
jgi:hypothetical protein